MYLLDDCTLTDFAYPDEVLLWDRIKAFEIDNPEARVPFSQRLAANKRWLQPYCDAAIAEYLKFCFLAVAAGPATPSETIDKVWHLHLQYTENYWDEFCEKALQYRLHHHPGNGNTEEHRIFASQYKTTIGYYRRYFGRNPPKNIWGVNR